MLKILLAMVLCFSYQASACEKEEWDDSKLHPTEQIPMPNAAGGIFGCQQVEGGEFRKQMFSELNSLTTQVLKEGQTPHILFIGAGYGAEPIMS